MQRGPTSTKFNSTNSNLKKIIFSFLNPQDQRKIYWLNKKFRSFLPDSALKINIGSLRKRSSYQMDDSVEGMQELSNGYMSFWMGTEISLLNYNINKNIENIKKVPLETIDFYQSLVPIKINENIIFTNGGNELRILNEEFNILETIVETDDIISLCIVSSNSFACALWNGNIKIYSRNENTMKYVVLKEYKDHSQTVNSLLYILKHDLLLSASRDRTINIYKSPEGKSITSLKDNKNCISSFLSLGEDSFVSGSFDGEIKFWNVKKDSSIEDIKTIKAYEGNRWVMLYLLGNEFLLSSQQYSEEFKIWNINTYECIQTFREDSKIKSMYTTKNNQIFTATNDDRVNVWEVSK